MALVGAALRRPAAGRDRDRRRRARSSPRRRSALKTGPAEPRAAAARTTRPARDAELIADSVGPGFEAPFVVVAATDDGPITEPDRLAALSRWQRRIADAPGRAGGDRPGAGRASAVEPLRELGNALLAADGNSGPLANARPARPQPRRAPPAASARLRGGISEAADGAGLLAEGSDRAEEGARRSPAAWAGRPAAAGSRSTRSTHSPTATKRLAEAQQRRRRSAASRSRPALTN